MQGICRIGASALLVSVLSTPGIALQAAQATSPTDLGRSWDEAYLHPEFNEGPSEFVTDVAGALKPGTALDVGIGQGRNAIYLAKRGWKVTGFDVSAVGISQTKVAAKAAHVEVDALLQSSDEFDWGSERWDLIVVDFFPQFRQVLPRIISSLRPGGMLLVEGYHADNPAGAGVTFKANELRALVPPSLHVVRYEEPVTILDWGQKRGRVVRLLAQKLSNRE
jgi:2-polyprenyl-3-methyl-5-hydroxy-6-metoxy-1,4-benzoquinol methylase